MAKRRKGARLAAKRRPTPPVNSGAQQQVRIHRSAPEIEADVQVKKARALGMVAKANYTRRLTQLFERALESVDWKFDARDSEDVRALEVEFTHRYLKRKISPQDYGLCNQGLRTLREILCPPPSITIIQGRMGEISFQGVKITNAADVDDLVRQGGVAYATAVESGSTDKELP
jgi:hypothetical protein